MLDNGLGVQETAVNRRVQVRRLSPSSWGDKQQTSKQIANPEGLCRKGTGYRYGYRY